jgi:ABC-type branched-subunit amino acid transport system substrate-binding protein
MHRRTRIATAICLTLAVTTSCTSSKTPSSHAATTTTTAVGVSPSTTPPVPTTSATAGNLASAPGITPTEILIGSDQDLSSALSTGLAEIAPAEAAYFAYVNDNGGVYGRKIVFKVLDDGGDANQAASVVHQLVQNDGAFAMFNAAGTATHLAVLGYLNGQAIPDLFVGSSCPCWNNPTHDPYTTGFAPNGVVEGAIEGRYVAQHYPGRRIGYLLQDDDLGTYGARGLNLEVPKAAVVSQQSYDAATDSDLSTQMTALMQAKADVIVSFSTPAFTALALVAAARLDYHPTFVVSNSGSDINTVTTLVESDGRGAASGSLLEGMVTDNYLPSMYSGDNPWAELFKRVHDRYDAKEPIDNYVAYGMSAAYTFVEALQAAGQNPTRATLMKALTTTSFVGPGLVPLTYTATDHQGYSGTQMGTIEGGEFVPAGAPLTATDAGAISAYTRSPALPPASGVPTSGVPTSGVPTSGVPTTG